MDINLALTYAKDPNLVAWSGWIGIIIGAIGIFLSIYFYSKSKRAKLPCCLTFTHSITSASTVSVKGLEILYRGEPVQNLAVTKFVFWNAGSETINKADVPANTPLRIGVTGNSVLLNHSLEFVKNPSNSVTFLEDNAGKSLLVQFDYFDRNDGFVLEILHTAESDNSVEVVGIFKGARPLVRRSAAPLLSLPKPLTKILASDARAFLGRIMIVTPFLITADIYFQITPFWWPQISSPETYADWVGFFIGNTLFFLSGIYLLRTRLPNGFNLKWD